MTPNECCCWLAYAIIGVYVARVLTFWFKATGMYDWFKEGIAAEAMWPTLISAWVASALLIGLFIGGMFLINRVVNGRWHG